MKIRATELRIKPFGTKLTYLALDGKEFDTMGECLTYDNKLKENKSKKELDYETMIETNKKHVDNIDKFIKSIKKEIFIPEHYETKNTYQAPDGKIFDNYFKCFNYCEEIDKVMKLKENKSKKDVVYEQHMDEKEFAKILNSILPIKEIVELNDGITVGDEEVYIPGHYDTKQSYFASDGKSFENYFECLTYNESITGVNKLKFKKITESYNKDETFDGAYFCNNQKEFDMLINYYECIEKDAGDNDFKGPGWYLIVIENDSELFTGFSVSSVDERLENITKFERQFIDWCGI